MIRAGTHGSLERRVTDVIRSDDGDRKYTQWTVLPLRRVSYYICALVALFALAGTVFASLLGLKTYRQLVFPHRAVHVAAAATRDGVRIVEPYFAPGGAGLSLQTTLALAIWFREGTPLPPLPDPGDEAFWIANSRRRQEERAHRRAGEQGYAVPEQVEQRSWEPVWTVTMENLDIERSRVLVSQVVLPGRIV